MGMTIAGLEGFFAGPEGFKGVAGLDAFERPFLGGAVGEINGDSLGCGVKPEFGVVGSD